MCVALPGIVLERNEKTAVVDFHGNTITARTGFIDIAPGDRVLVHAGCILQKVSQTEAEELTKLFDELESATQKADDSNL